MTRIILVRHGKSTYNQERRIQGRLDKSILTEAGRAGAKQVGDILSSITFDAAYTSPLQRAKETAEIILSRLTNPPQLQPTDKLMEIDLPLWEGMLRQEAIDQFPEAYQQWQQHPDKFSMKIPSPEGEIEHFPVLAVFASARKFWKELLSRHTSGTILVVGHNGINRALIATASEIAPDYYQSIQQSNCGISVINLGSADEQTESNNKIAVQLESLNLTAHTGEIFPKPRDGHSGPRLLLVRHGETDWNRAGKFQGQIDVPLNDNGREQARQAAEFLKDVKLDFAISSSMLRPKETAEIILKYHGDLQLELRDELREISHGLWEGKFESEIEASYPGLLEEWKISPEKVQMPEGENLEQVWTRAIAAWREIVKSVSGTGIVVAHDAVNKALLCHLFNLEPEHFWKFKQGNGAVSVIDYPHGPDGLPVLQAMNITTHLSGGVFDQTAAGAL
ncbi:MAG: histidine phosphatase family protein [Microcoleus sp. PH2017_29_MFU_D_A]|jgi:phosphoserine phosphatase|uniref:histidine phosphatase family protein n=1 Tax=unclassified Microcoleus TaxID=2642155 RepID=UPI001D56E45E|nr:MULTISPECIES: histidine phosphatase family protein [unclassified Microcoleus]MCC3417524.1 histidine phosphatase family protein [Microcoleus sp. PH2017_07_MST_O_A]MCC3442881.1 histidine phosphatase family protein [Microcoleus sp. PH2017_03_ELD_O_A]MCC3464902.1 histidine phosphatase family protein [Microcoleus sp. PH2017_06_SFM_O_A]MCC3504990.1 histidine phosphatase family protein [Microcoleus sp. PH2017_19_SFW_U_A]MCC3508021.1 histidine phosphatase family protein [Microcoleus sp. PH2017_17_B